MSASATHKRTEFTSGRSDEIMTYSGIVFRPLEPEPEQIVIEDIAHALANSCRFTGHVSSFYSVAQHSIFVSHLVDNISHHDNQLTKCALLHDASEAYLSDIARPVKRAEPFSKAYDKVELPLMEAVAAAFDIPWPMPEAVKWADDVLLRAEQRDLMSGTYDTAEADEWWPDPIDPWPSYYAEERFLERYSELFD